MEVEILKERDNRLLERRELNLKISYEEGKGTPKLDEIRNVITSKLNLNPSLTVIDRIDQTFGVHYANVYAKVYDNENAMKVERRPVLRKNFGEEKTNALLGVKKKKEGKKKKTTPAAQQKK